MSALTFSLKAPPARRLDLSPLTAERLHDLKHKEILRLALETAAQPLLVGDVFAVKGSDAAEIRFDTSFPENKPRLWRERSRSALECDRSATLWHFAGLP